jgi:OOP family OmpA-OmpF porin
LESIHLECARELEEFKSDTTPFITARPYLEECLQQQTDTPLGKGKPTLSWGVRLVLFGLVAALAWWGYHTFQDNQRWAAYLERLKAEPGVVVVTSEKHRGKWFVRGLRDPLAADPMALLQEAGIDPTNVVSQWEPYQALRPQFILTRAKATLSPPESITLRFDNGTLTVEGSASRQWLDEARKLARAIPGVTNFLETATADANTSDVAARDANSPGQELQRKEMLAAKERLEQQTVQFFVDTLDLMSGQDAAVRDIAGTVRILLAAAQFVGQTVRIEVIGHGDASSAPLGDQFLGLTRAVRVIGELARNGLTQSDLTVLKARIEDASQGKEAELQSRGKVSFRVKLLDQS